MANSPRTPSMGGSILTLNTRQGFATAVTDSLRRRQSIIRDRRDVDDVPNTALHHRLVLRLRRGCGVASTTCRIYGREEECGFALCLSRNDPVCVISAYGFEFIRLFGAVKAACSSRLFRARSLTWPERRNLRLSSEAGSIARATRRRRGYRIWPYGLSGAALADPAAAANARSP